MKRSSEQDALRDEIVLMSAVDAIRARPLMYFETTDNLVETSTGISEILCGAACLSLENAAAGRATNVEIEISCDGEIRVFDDGPGLDPSLRPATDMSEIETIFTELFACRHRKRPEVGDALCRLGMVVVNALSQRLTYESVVEHKGVRVRYEQGVAASTTEPFESKLATAQTLRCLPDEKIFGCQQIDTDYFVNWFRVLPIELGQAVVVLSDLRTGLETQLT